MHTHVFENSRTAHCLNSGEKADRLSRRRKKDEQQHENGKFPASVASRKVTQNDPEPRTMTLAYIELNFKYAWIAL